MATVSVSFFRPSVIRDGVTAVADGSIIAAEDLTSSSSSTATTISSTDRLNVCRISTTGDIWVQFATNPTADAGQDFLLTAGSAEYFVLPVGFKIAVKDA